MRIGGIDSLNESQLSQVGASPGAGAYGQAQPAPASTGALASDYTDFSQTASLVSRTMSLPEVNSARVGQVQKAIASGQFRVDAGQTATALMGAMLDGAWS